ncbi:transporter substrate-binding domain-containing protein [Roseovarius sp. S1116L3]|uniref:transporter substrate-binding domain-containing protein n=1 Tax=Roseovarius roseus TaxID=3342636 RepID=UPI003726C01D
MKLKTTLTAGAAALALMTGAALAETVKVGIAAEPYPPFAAPDSAGNWTGWEVEMIGAICNAAELECEITPTAWDGIIPSLMGEQIDVIMASMSITEDRAKQIDFSDHYYKTPAVIVASKGSDIAPTAEGLSGKILGVQASTTHQAYAQKHFEDAAAEIRVYQTQDEANQDLYSGRIDAIQADSIAMADFVESETGSSCCEIVGAVEDDVAILGQGVGAGVRKGDDELREKLNMGIAKVLEDGTHEEITAKYFSAPIYSK